MTPAPAVPRRSRRKGLLAALALLPLLTGCQPVGALFQALGSALTRVAAPSPFPSPTPSPTPGAVATAAGGSSTTLASPTPTPTPTPPGLTIGPPRAPWAALPRADTTRPSPGSCGRDVALVGDSITASSAYPAALRTLCPGTRFTNSPEPYARAGKSTRSMAADFPRVLQGSHDTLVLLGGVNNIDEPEQVVRDLTSMASAARRRGWRVVLVTVMPFRGYSSWSPARHASLLRVNAALRSLASSSGLALFDAFRHMKDPADPRGERLNPAWTADRLHPNAAGYRAMAQGLHAALTRR